MPLEGDLVEGRKRFGKDFEAMVNEIRTMYRKGCDPEDIAREAYISVECVGHVVHSLSRPL